MAAVSVRDGTLDDIERIYAAIPEFDQEQNDASDFMRRLSRDHAIVLVAEVGGGLAGFKAGYDRYRDGSFYSWLGAVLPEYRKQGVALALMEAQEARLKELGFDRVYVKTRNKFVAMRVLLARNGYLVIDVDTTHGLDEGRITHVKYL